MFSLEDRKRFIEETFKTNKVTVITYEGRLIYVIESLILFCAAYAIRRF
jgi:hypothetical protein